MLNRPLIPNRIRHPLRPEEIDAEDQADLGRRIAIAALTGNKAAMRLAIELGLVKTGKQKSSTR